MSRKREDHSALIFRSAISSLAVFDTEGNTIEANDAYCNMVGYSKEEILSMNLYDLIKVPSESATSDTQFLKRHGSHRFQISHKNRNGGFIDCEINTTFLPDRERVFINFRDISDLKKVEHELQWRFDFELLISEFSAILINRPIKNIEMELKSWLKRIADHLNVDYVGITELSEDCTSFLLTQDYIVSEITPPPIDHRSILHLLFTEPLKRGEIIKLDRIPDDIPSDIDTCELDTIQDGIKSFLAIPFTAKGSTIGSIFFTTFREYRVWPDEVVIQLKLLGEIIANFLLRKKAEIELEERLNFEIMISEFSTALINLPPDKLFDELKSWFKKIVEFLGVDRCVASEYVDDYTGIRPIQSYSKFHPNQLSPGRTRPTFGLIEELQDGKILKWETIPSPDKLPDRLIPVRDSLINQGIKSLIAIPLHAGNRIIGILFFSSLTKERTWSDDIIRRLKIVGEIISNALIRNRAIESLGESEKRYRQLFETAPVSIAEEDFSHLMDLIDEGKKQGVQDFGGYIEHHPDFLIKASDKIRLKNVNAETLRLYGAKNLAQLLEGNPHTLIPADKSQILLKEVLIALAENRDHVEGETIHRTMQGDLRNVLCKIALPRDKQNMESVLVSRVDITSLKHAEEALEREKERFRILVEEAPFGIFIYNSDGVIKYINPKFIELFGYTLDEISTYEDWYRKAYPNDKYRDRILASIHSKNVRPNSSKPRDRTLMINCKDGSEKVVYTRFIILKNDDRLIIYEDITRRTNLEAQMQQAQKMEAVGTLAGGIAHDFNNLLQGIQGYSQLLLYDKSKEDPDYYKLMEIVKAAERAGELTERLLTFSRKVESKLRPLDINQILQQAHMLLERTIPKMIQIELRLAEEIMIINADPVQIEQVIMNMAINARDAMPDGGKLTFRTSNIKFDEDYSSTHLGIQPGDYVELTISDTGYGIKNDMLEHIFEPFFTTKEVGKGTGLGLSMVYGIIKNHKGDIGCSSVSGKGTTFRILLPALKKAPDMVIEELNEIAPEKGSETILLVDDEETIRELGVDILSRFGYKSLTCPDGESALRLYQDNKNTISLIILDLIMPGMGGRRCLQEIIEFDPDAKVIIASGYLRDDALKDSFLPQVKGYVNKPYDFKQMLKVVRDILDED